MVNQISNDAKIINAAMSGDTQAVDSWLKFGGG